MPAIARMGRFYRYAIVTKPRTKQALRGKNDPLARLPCRGADTIMRELITGSI